MIVVIGLCPVYMFTCNVNRSINSYDMRERRLANRRCYFVALVLTYFHPGKGHVVFFHFEVIIARF